MDPLIGRTISLIRGIFSNFDEIWLVGPKNDYCDSLVDVCVIEESDISVVHTHSSSGEKFSNAHHFFLDQDMTGGLFDAFDILNRGIEEEVRRVGGCEKRVALLMPHPNRAFSNIVSSLGLDKFFYSTAPVASPDLYEFFEDKSNLYRFISQEYLIRSTQVESLDTFASIRQRLDTADNAIIIQQCFSAGGGGTVRVSNQQDLDTAMLGARMAGGDRSFSMKASIEIGDAYPANGSACIVPVNETDCEVYVDPLSHKVVETDPLSSHRYGSLGNDWTNVWSETINREYIRIATQVGKRMYRRWGYSGLIGLDFLIKLHDGGRSARLYITEINPRWQGTTLYQTRNALLSGRIPLEFVNYVLKLSDDSRDLQSLRSMLGSVDDYNIASVRSPGGFYVKLYAPDTPRPIVEDINGWWLVGSGGMRRLEGWDFDYRENGDCLVFIKAPRKGVSTRLNLTAMCYVYSAGPKSIFQSCVPRQTDLYDTIKSNVEGLLYGGDL